MRTANRIEAWRLAERDARLRGHLEGMLMRRLGLPAYKMSTMFRKVLEGRLVLTLSELGASIVDDCLTPVKL